MAEIKKLIKRRNSAKSTKKITKTMSLVAAAKSKGAARRAQAIRPYTQKFNELIADLMISNETLEHPLAHKHDQEKKIAVLALTANRGFCGAYNTRVFASVATLIDKIKEEKKELVLHMVGKKGLNYFKKRCENFSLEGYLHLKDEPDNAEVMELAEKFMDQYTRGEIDKLIVVSMDFASSSRQNVTHRTLLPFPMDEFKDQKQTSVADYFVYPDPEQIFNYLVPQCVRANLFGCFLEAKASEHIQRMIAMNTATDNAEKMIKELTQLYNRARQAQITTEILELMGAAKALGKV